MKGLNHFDGILYINLDHRKDRRESIESQLSIQGVSEGKIHCIPGHHHPLNGHLGCALSHCDAIRFAMEKGWEDALILEDDVVFIVDEEMTNIYIQAFMQQVKKWDVFFLSTLLRKCTGTSWFKIIRVLNCLGSHAYAVQDHYFPVLLDYYYESCCRLLKKDSSYHESNQRRHTLDHRWSPLLHKDLWYSGL